MTAKIYSRTTAKGVQTYYLTDGKKEYCLIRSNYRKSNMVFFSRARSIGEVLNARRHVSSSVQRISVRLISMVKYIENEQGICVLKQTAKRQQRKVRSTKMLKRSERALIAV